MADLWFKLAVDFPTHPKVILAGPDAAWLAVCAMAYARKHMTNGVIPVAVVPTLAAVKRPLVLAAKLVEVGLWESHTNAFMIHDFLKWNPSREEINEKREKWNTIKKNQRSVHDGQTRESTVESIGESTETPRVRVDTHAPDVRSDSDSDSSVGVDLGRGAGETNPIAPVWGNRGRSASLLAGPLAHGKCYQSAACERGLCIPRFLGDQWQRQCNGDMAQVQAFVTAALVGVSGPVGDDPLAWWREQWKAKHGSVARSGNRPTADDIRAANDANLEAALAGRMR
jgi:hypothetical protein